MKLAYSLVLVLLYITCCLSSSTTRKNNNATKLIARKFKSRNTHNHNNDKKTTAEQRDEIQSYFLPSGLGQAGLGNDLGLINNDNGINSNLNGVIDGDAAYSNANSFHGDGVGDVGGFYGNEHHVNQGFQGDAGGLGIHGDAAAGFADQQQIDHRLEGPHPHVQLEQNIFKGRPQHVFDKNPQHIYNERTRHVTSNQQPLHVVQGKQIEITTKPQHVNVHFYQYDKQGKARMRVFYKSTTKNYKGGVYCKRTLIPIKVHSPSSYSHVVIFEKGFVYHL